MVALNYATTQLEATHVLVTLAIHLMQTTIHAMVSDKTVLWKCDYFYAFHFNIKTSMNVCLGQVVAFNYATTPLEATHAIVTLATHLL